MKKTKNTTKKLLIITLIFSLSISFFVPCYSMDRDLSSESFSSTSEKENTQTIQSIDPKSSRNSMDITKTADILDGTCYDAMIVGTLAYVADGYGGLRIIDISDPTTPTEVGLFDDNTWTKSVFVVGSYAYIASEFDGLVIIDISDPTNPTKVGTFDDNTWTQSVFVVGSYAYIASEFDGLVIIDISDPTTPTKVGQFDDGGFAFGIYVMGSYAYLSEMEGLKIIDISDPNTPIKVGQ